MAEVYVASASNEQGERELFAVKLVLPHLKDDPGFATMFLREASIASRLDHPNIAKIVDYGFESSSGEHFLAMEYVRGENLRTLLRVSSNHGGLPWSAGLAILSRVAEALHHAHGAVDDKGEPLGLVHRDVSPSNVLIRYDGVIKLVDFGIAKVTNRTHTTVAGSLKGKMGYMSPEQCRCESVDRRSDIFGLGILMYETTLGRRLFVAKNEYGAIGKILRGEFKRPSEVMPGYPPELERIILRCLAPNRDERYSTAAEVIDALRRFAGHLGISLSQDELALTMDAMFPVHTRTELPVEGADRTARIMVAKREALESTPAGPDSLVESESSLVSAPLVAEDGPQPTREPPFARYEIRQAIMLGAAMATAFWMAMFGAYSIYAELQRAKAEAAAKP